MSKARRTNVTIRLTPCRSRDKGRLLWQRLDSRTREGALVARVRDQDAARRMLTLLNKAGRETRLLLPNQTESEQAQCVAWFKTADRPALVTAGNLEIPGREDIRQLYVMNLPPSLTAAWDDLEATGRDCLAADAEFFASRNDFLFWLKELPEESKSKRVALNESVEWIERDGCARQFLINTLFAEKTGVCGNCGFCLGKPGRLLPSET